MNLTDYVDWAGAYRHFNERLFGGRLPEVVFTLHRHARALGYASMDRFEQRDSEERLHELAMNLDHLLGRDDVGTLSTLVHEQVHIEQFCFGDPGRGRYHNKQWADWMERVGLVPSTTGKPGGKRTGQRVTHYVAEGGPFAKAAAELLATGWRVKRGSVKHDANGGDKSKVKFTCPGCAQNAWAKEAAKLVCGACERPMETPR